MIRRTVRTTKVELRSGDEAICEGAIETPDVIKIDVEGHELQVLKRVRYSPWRSRTGDLRGNAFCAPSSGRVWRGAPRDRALVEKPWICDTLA
jgi:Methyltransferase FkbM domain